MLKLIPIVVLCVCESNFTDTIMMQTYNATYYLVAYLLLFGLVHNGEADLRSVGPCV